MALTAVGLASMGLFVSVEGGYPSVLAGLLALGAGMGLSMTPSTEAITAALPAGQQGVASALNDVTREFGTALGVAMLGALVATGYQRALDDRLDGVPGVPRTPRGRASPMPWRRRPAPARTPGNCSTPRGCPSWRDGRRPCGWAPP